MKSITKYCSLLFLGVTVLGTSLNAAIITWSAATTIASDLDVSTAGTLHEATNLGALINPTVNGVGFSGQQPASYSNHTTAFGPFTGAFSNLSTGYQSLLRSASFLGGTFTLTLTSLTIGQEYEFRAWSNDSRALAAGRQTILTTGISSITLTQNTTGVAGGLGQYAIGTFVADAITQDIIATHTVDGIALMNGYQVVAVPEPQTWALVAQGWESVFFSALE